MQQMALDMKRFSREWKGEKRLKARGDARTAAAARGHRLLSSGL
jgi:hypothetical protein